MAELGETSRPKIANDQDSEAPSDRITVGDIGKGAAVAVGRGARAINRILNIDIRLLPAVLLLIAIVVVLLYLLVRPTVPRAMSGEFNVAIAEFIVVDQDGMPVKSNDGQMLADFLFQRLEIGFDELDLQIPYEIWPPAYTGRITGEDREQRAQAAEAIAQRIGAHVIVYGIITQAGNWSEFTPEFYVNYRGFEEGEEITGQHELGSPLRITCPFEVTQLQGVENPALCGRVNALTLVTIGLAYYAADDFERALDYFTQAESTEGWLQNAGKEVIYLLLGNANARLASKEKSTDPLKASYDHYETALAINPTYARAKVGQAGVLYLMALGDPEDQSFDSVNLSKLDQAATTFQAAVGLGDPPESANIETKVHFGLGQIHFVRAIATGGNWLPQAESEFLKVVQDYEGGNARVVELAGHAYARLGVIARLEGDMDAAAESYLCATQLVSPYYQAYYFTRLGEVYAAAGESDAAIEAYTEALRIAEFYGDNENAIEYSERLRELRNGQ
jgi:tetratricopeptide (TPR) repeat protein